MASNLCLMVVYCQLDPQEENAVKVLTKYIKYSIQENAFYVGLNVFSNGWCWIDPFLDLHPADEKRRYKVTPSLIGWAQT